MVIIFKHIWQTLHLQIWTKICRILNLHLIEIFLFVDCLHLPTNIIWGWLYTCIMYFMKLNNKIIVKRCSFLSFFFFFFYQQLSTMTVCVIDSSKLPASLTKIHIELCIKCVCVWAFIFWCNFVGEVARVCLRGRLHSWSFYYRTPWKKWVTAKRMSLLDLYCTARPHRDTMKLKLDLKFYY